MDATLAFVGSGAAMGTILGTSLLGARRTAPREARLPAFLLVAISLAMLSISIQHGRTTSGARTWLELFEYVTALAAGPLFAGWVRSRARDAAGLRPIELLHFLPAVAIGGHILATSSVVVPFRLVMLAQMAYTLAALREIVLARRRGVAPAILRWPSRFVALTIAVHLAQIVRAVAFDVDALRNVVPITAIAALEVLAVIAFRESILGARSSEPHVEARERKPREDDASLLPSIDAAMQEEELWRDPNLTLDRLAAAVEATPQRVSSALNASRGGFFEYVASFRLDAAKSALLDPANDRLTIDALAGDAGFRSRSTFYAAFRKRFGVTPSELRRRDPEPPVPDAPRASASPSMSRRAP